MIKLEANIGVWNSDIHEIDLTVELTQEEYDTLKTMNTEEYIKFMRERMVHRITDYDLTYDVPDLDEFCEVEAK